MIRRKTRTYRKQRRLLTGVQKCEHAIMAIGSAIARREYKAWAKAQGWNVKKITRRQARAWLLPMRQCLRQIRATGEADSIWGYAVTRLHASYDYARIDYCAAGFRALMERICPQIDTAPLLRIEQRLSAGVPLEVEHIDASLRMLMAVENNLIKHSVAEVKEAVMIEQILIEMAEMIEMNKMRKAA